MLKWGRTDRATATIRKIYAHATEEQIQLKVRLGLYVDYAVL